MNLTDYVVSTLRTAVPAGIGAVLAWLASVGLGTGAEANTGAITFFTALAIALYYGIVRLIEPKLPGWLRVVLLGANKAPVYTKNDDKPAARAF